MCIAQQQQQIPTTPTPSLRSISSGSSCSSSISSASQIEIESLHNDNNIDSINNDNNNTDCSSSSSDAFCDLLICPISLELPFEPVTAQDGRVYDKEAIELHFQSQMERIGQVKSPITNQVLDSTRLIPAIQHKQLIEAAIERGIITGELAETWNHKMEEKQINDTLQKLAKRGDVIAMQQVSYNYLYGIEGFPHNVELSFRWATQAHRAGSTMGTATMGFMLIKGLGVRRPNPTKGIRLLTKAAHNGSAWAACRLGIALADGLYGLQVDYEVAIHWLQVSLSGSCPYDDITGSGKSKAQMKLDELLFIMMGNNNNTDTTMMSDNQEEEDDDDYRGLAEF